MDIEKLNHRLLNRIDPRIANKIYALAKKIPFVRNRLENEFATVFRHLERDLKPYKDHFDDNTELPPTGRGHEAVLEEMTALTAAEGDRWREGYASGAVYHGDEAHIAFLNRIYALHSQSNPLHADLWASTIKYEAEIVAMTARMLGGNPESKSSRPEDITCGTVTSGGTESILLAMKTYRDRARATRKNAKPELVVPVSAHAAFDKAAEYFDLRIKHIPLDRNFRADLRAARRAITRNTIALVGSAPSFPHGTIDPIPELAALAREKRIGFHTDACLGGFILPWATRLGYDVPTFDFRLPGVTSMSADTHKYGYAAKGTSVVLYRGSELRRFQYFKTTDWPGGLYFSPTFAGSRPGALSAACWAAMMAMGRDGYTAAAKAIFETGAQIKAGIAAIPGLHILGDPLWVIAFAADSLDIYRIMERMGQQGWSLNGLHNPACVHLCVTLRHTQPGVAQRFLGDLAAAVDYVQRHPQEAGSMAPVYGLAANLPARGVVGDMLENYIDMLYRI